jgi:hypothetical protein
MAEMGDTPNPSKRINTQVIGLVCFETQIGGLIHEFRSNNQ